MIQEHQASGAPCCRHCYVTQPGPGSLTPSIRLGGLTAVTNTACRRIARTNFRTASPPIRPTVRGGAHVECRTPPAGTCHRRTAIFWAHPVNARKVLEEVDMLSSHGVAQQAP